MMLKEREVNGIRIDEEGKLEIQRGEDFKLQICNFSDAAGPCGDSCPHFGEPEYQNNRIFLSLCAGTILCTFESDFEDLRE